LPVDPATGEKCLGEIEEQALLTLRNVEAILQAAGSSLDKVVKTTVFISDISLWSRVNTVYAEVFGQWRPARSVVPVSELHYGFKIEIEVVAVVG
jgi:2-iminobutanoate/2-iminopropanoate deaminase